MYPRFYIYVFIDGMNVLYVGKGSGDRLKTQEKRFGFQGKIIERIEDERIAYEREKHWIAQLRPTENKNKGGGGVVYEPDLPNGLTPEGLPIAAPYLARLVMMALRNPDMIGVMRIVCAYVDKHGIDSVAKAIKRYLPAFKIKDLGIEPNAI